MSEEIRPTTQELLKLIGRTSGKGLSQTQARQLFEGIFSQSLDEMQIGAALMALRVRGESAHEMLGALEAMQAHLRPIELATARPVVVIPTYNGSRQIANLVPLLACLLADEGFSVLVHGVRTCPGRISTAEIFHALGIEAIETGAGESAAAELSAGVNNRIARGDPAFVPVDVLSPALARLLARRDAMGVRNTGHSMVKLLQPVRFVPAPAQDGRANESPRLESVQPGCLQLVSYTHAEFHALQQDVLMQLGARALQSRGCEGEVVAHPRRATVHHWIHQGRIENLLEGDTLEASETPVLPAAQDVAATATWIQAVLSGAAPVPRALARQLDCIRLALTAGAFLQPETARA